jgi:hypothetical protein
MKKTLMSAVLNSKAAIAVLIDESTSIGRLSCLNVYFRTTVDEAVGPVTFFLDVVELDDTTAGGIASHLLKCLSTYGLSEEYLVEHWIGLAVDGASVMLGNKSGVATQLKAKFPLLLSWHCFNHRLELAVSDAVKCCVAINDLKSFMDTLYATYSMSPKMQRELAECASELEVQLARIGRVLDVRWVASSCRSVAAVWRSYVALHAHFTVKSRNSRLDGKERAKFAGMSKKLESPIFIQNLGLMYDALEELSDLSLALQKSDITLPAANKLIFKQVQVFRARKECDSEHYSEACKAVEAGTFKGIPLARASGNERIISKAQFYQALADSMVARMIPESEKSLSTCIEVLDVGKIPLELSPEFGEQQLKTLCIKFAVNFREVKVAYRDFKETRGSVVQPALQQLLNAINTIPISTAECERGFSKMNLVCNTLRSRLTVKHMSSLMFISLTDPPLARWQPLPYVKSWLLLNRRAATSGHGMCKQSSSALDVYRNHTSVESVWKLL